jgi:hypothetical protein
MLEINNKKKSKYNENQFSLFQKLNHKWEETIKSGEWEIEEDLARESDE